MNILIRIGLFIFVLLLSSEGAFSLVFPLKQNRETQNVETNVEYCYASDPSPYKRFSTKTVYDFDKHMNTTKPTLPAKCKPVQLWSVIRHGIRLQEPDEVLSLKNDLPKIQQEIISNYEKKSYKSRLCEEDFYNIKNWKLDPVVSFETAYELADSGAQQVAELADRFRRDYSSLFDFPYNENNYVVHSYDDKAITKSCDIFLDRLFNYTGRNFADVTLINDKEFRFSMDLPEPNRFLETSMVQEMLLDVSEKLGYTKTPLNWTSVKLLFDMCRYDNAWHLNELSPWCAVFTTEQKKLFEYHEDLFCYYEHGYGDENAMEVGCTTIKSMMYYFMKIANNELNQPKGILIFSHRSTFEGLFVSLSAKKDPYILTADSYEYSTDRKWKTSDDILFSAHVTATFYSCDDNEKYIQFILNEEPLELDIPGCEKGICPWQSVFNKFKPIADNCGLD